MTLSILVDETMPQPSQYAINFCTLNSRVNGMVVFTLKVPHLSPRICSATKKQQSVFHPFFFPFNASLRV